MNTVPENLKLTTGRLYWQKSGENGFIDLGNCTSHKTEPDIQRLNHWKYERGTKRVDMSLVTSLTPKRVFTFDEHFARTLELQFMATLLSYTPPTSGVDVPVVFPLADLVLGRSYYMGAQNVTVTAAETGASTPLVEGVDYSIDKPSGMLTILSAANFDDDWEFTVNYTGVDTLDFTMFSKLLEQGTFKFVEADQFDPVPAGMETITGTVYVTGWGDGSSDKFQEFTIEVLSIE